MSKDLIFSIKLQEIQLNYDNKYFYKFWIIDLHLI